MSKINDDMFFSILASITAAFKAFSNLFWGYLADKYTLK